MHVVIMHQMLDIYVYIYRERLISTLHPSLTLVMTSASFKMLASGSHFVNIVDVLLAFWVCYILLVG